MLLLALSKPTVNSLCLASAPVSQELHLQVELHLMVPPHVWAHSKTVLELLCISTLATISRRSQRSLDKESKPFRQSEQTLISYWTCPQT